MMENKIEIVGEEENLQLAENEYVEEEKMSQMNLKISVPF